MSDADNQMGGSGGESGPDPTRVTPGKDNAAPGEVESTETAPRDDDQDDEPSQQSFPASDPPGKY